MKKLSIIVTGPTAVGKTEIVEKLIQSDPSKFVMVNVDLGQFYTPLNIGTAKPVNLHEYNNELFNVLNEPEDWNISKFRQVLQDVLNKVWNQKKIPILVGGSSFYMKSFFFPPAQIEAPIEATNVLGQEYNNINTLDLWTKLSEIDPERAQAISKNDRYRIERALKIWETTGNLPSQYKAKFEPLSDFIFIFANRNRQELYEAIDKRTYIMIKEGWVDEVSKLDNDWKEFLLKKKIIGYPEIINYLEAQNGTLDSLIEEIAQKTRNYAKRQVTFLNGLKKQLKDALPAYLKTKPEFFASIEETNLTFTQINLYIEELIKKISNYLND